MSTKKDVIYIDIEDEITGIISKMKASKSKIVALVLPKRSTVLNSVVNLKLLKRASEDSGKNFVLITNERSINSLAGGLDLFVAKNLHSKPEIPETSGAPEIDDSTIEGAEIEISPEKPVGELEESFVQKKVDLRELNKPDEAKPPAEAKEPEVTPKEPSKKSEITPIKKKSMKVPNFESFRLRIMMIVAGILILVGGWFWAFKIAPKAVITITTQTSRVDT
ncbi:MAG: hypothetical protein R3313_01930, partial [Candidatus Saccharimonadales bacterium]|nr:hypothetical protein [Candidatus Saccharimonadales bacterium]